MLDEDLVMLRFPLGVLLREVSYLETLFMGDFDVVGLNVHSFNYSDYLLLCNSIDCISSLVLLS